MNTDGVTITFELRLKPEAVPGFLESFPPLLKDTAGFAGFRTIRVVQHKDDPSRILLVELWDSAEAYQKYIVWRTERGDFDNLAPLTVSTEVDIWPNLIAQI